jgi:O-antigen ligase
MLRDDPIWGVGTGNFGGAYARHVDKSDRWQDSVTGDPHNQFLKIWVEQGIFGLAAFLFFIGHALTRPGRSPYRELAAAVLMGWCATSLFSSHFSNFVEGRMIFFWLGAMLAWKEADRTGPVGASAEGAASTAAGPGGSAPQSDALSSSALNWMDWSFVPSFR